MHEFSSTKSQEKHNIRQAWEVFRKAKAMDTQDSLNFFFMAKKNDIAKEIHMVKLIWA
jgi:hypothetical protein